MRQEQQGSEEVEKWGEAGWCSHQRSLGVGREYRGRDREEEGGARHRPGPELPPWPAWLT